MRSIFPWVLGPLAAFAVVKGGPAVHAAAPLTYEQHIVPIFREKCFACHGPDRKSGGLRLNSYASVMMGGASGEAVKPGDAGGSLLYKLITHQQEPHMPPRSEPLAKDMLEHIKSWIESGALEKAGSPARMASRPKLDLAVGALARARPSGPPPMPANLSREPVVLSAKPNAVTALAASPWAPLVALGGQKQVLLYNTDTAELVGVLPFPEGIACTLKFSRNGKLLLAGGGHAGKSGRVIVWDVITGKRMFEVGDGTDQVLAADISPDQTQIALGGPGKTIRVYATADGKLLHEIRKHTDWILALAYSPDGVLLASADRAGGLQVWEAFTAREYLTLRGHTAAVNDLAWRADSNLLASASEDATVRLWEMENGAQVKAWGGGGPVESVHYAADGRIATCGRDHWVRLWDGAGNGQRNFGPLPDVALRVAFSHDAARLIAGDWHGGVTDWRTADGKAMASLSVNPPALPEQFEQAVKAVTLYQTEAQHWATSAQASQAAAQKCAAELAALERSAAETSAAARIVAEALAAKKAAVDRVHAALAAAQDRLRAREVTTQAYNQALQTIQKASDQAKTNQELLHALAKAKDVSAAAATDLTQAQKEFAAQVQAVTAATTDWNAAQQANAFTSSSSATAAQRLQQFAPAAKAARDKAAAEQVATQDAAASLVNAQQTYEHLKALLASRSARK